MGYSALLNELKRNKNNKLYGKKQVIDWLARDYTHEVTLTFPYEPKNRWYCEKTFKKYQLHLNDRCFKHNKGQYLESKIIMAVFLEGEITNKRLHYHCAMTCPMHMDYYYFERRIKKTWADTLRNPSTRVVVKPYTNKGWLSYSTKEISLLHTDAVSEHTSL